jgi:hypothetical protein
VIKQHGFSSQDCLIFNFCGSKQMLGIIFSIYLKYSIYIFIIISINLQIVWSENSHFSDIISGAPLNGRTLNILVIFSSLKE